MKKVLECAVCMTALTADENCGTEEEPICFSCSIDLELDRVATEKDNA